MYPIYSAPRVIAMQVPPANREEDMPQPRHYNPEYCMRLEAQVSALVAEREEAKALYARAMDLL